MNKRYILAMFLLGMVLQNAICQIDIQTNPINTSLCPGDTAMFEVSVSMDTDSVIWQYSNSSAGPWMPLSFDVNGVETIILSVFNSQFYNGKFFRIIALDGGVPVDSSNGASLTQRIPPIPTIDPTVTEFCMGLTDTLDAGTGFNSYLWSNDSTTQRIVVTIGAIYYVTVTDDNGCVGTSSATVIVNLPPPPIVFTPSFPKICPKGDTSVVISTVFQYDTYLWSTQETSPSIEVDTTGSIALTVTNAFGCTANNAIPVTNYTPSTVDIIPSMAEFCEGDSILLTAIGGNYTYIWSQGGTNQSITVKDGATYSVTVTDTNGCLNSDDFKATVQPNPVAAFRTYPDELTNILVLREILFIDSSISTGAPLENWIWDFGENAEPPFAEYSGESDSTLVKYTQPGIKRVKLTVTDINGCSSMDSIPFVVNPTSAPEVTLIQIPPAARCIGDTVVVLVTVRPVETINYKVLDTINWNEAEEFLISQTNEFYDDTRLTREAKFVFTQPGSFDIIATGWRQRKATGEQQSAMAVLNVNTGSVIPYIESIHPSTPFLCEGDLMNFNINISPMEDADIEYTINIMPSPLGKATNGLLVIENVAAPNEAQQLILNIVSINLNNGCKNGSPNFNVSIDVRPKPDLIVADSTEACLNSLDTLMASGADSFEWYRYGVTLVSNSPKLPLPTDSIQTIFYEVVGRTNGCSSVDTTIVKIIAPPNPVITGEMAVCKGQVVTYTSNSIDGNFWSVIGGDTISSRTEAEIKVQWHESGSITLLQEVGTCSKEIVQSVDVSNENSPPYDTLIYLSGGGILLYPNPNPDLIPKLCYKWFKDGQLLPDTYQGCIVGTNLDSIELSRYSVEVTYCGQGDECAQLISYRAYQDVPGVADFKLKVLPNPNDGVFTLEYEISDTGIYIQYIFDSSGRLIHKESMILDLRSGKLDLVLPNAETGIYFIKLLNSVTGEYLVVPVSILH